MSSTPVRARAPRKPPAERARDIAVAAREIALEQGLSALTVRAVAARAGVAHTLVVHYVVSMDSLVADTYSAIVAAEIVEIETMLAPLHSPAGRLGLLITTLLDGTRDATTGVWVDGWAIARRNETLAIAVRGQADAWQAVVVRVIDDGITAGDFSTDDPAAVAWQLLGMIDGLNAQALVRRDYESERAFLLCAVAERLLGLEGGTLARG